MDEILNRVCSIVNHPVAQMDEKFRIEYVKGLGACLFLLSQDSSITFFYFQAWATSILKTPINVKTFWRNDVDAIRSAVSLKHKGLWFFSMKKDFFFDVFYLLESSCIENYKQENAFTYLNDNICGVFTKGTLSKSHHAYKDKADLSFFNNVLVSHMQQNLVHLKLPEKRVLVVANVSAGKSTLINALVGYRFNRTKTTACTDKLVFIHNKCSKDGITCKIKNGVYTYSENINEVNSDSLIEAALPFKSSLGKEKICFIDTPGINNADNCSHKQITEDIIKKGDYDVVLYVSNCQYFGTNDEHKLLKFLKINVTKPILFVLNQLDVFNPEEDSIHKMLNDYKSDLIQFGFRNPIIIPVSAYASFLIRLEPSCLTKTEIRKKIDIIELFKDEYYNLPQYIRQGNSSDILDKTGIKILENKILTV